MKLAFLIQAHKGFNQLKLLLDYLNINDCDIYLHVDLKSEELFKKIQQIKSKYKNLILLENRKDVNWSGFSQVESTLEMMKLANKNGYDYISLISGQDLLVKKISELKLFLQENKGTEFIEYEDIKEKEWRLKKFSFFRENKKNRTFFLRILDNIIRRIQPKILRRKNLQMFEKLYYGSQWFTITSEANKYILEYSKNFQLKKEFEYTNCPDEHYFQTILLNSKFKKKCNNNNLRYIDWHDCRNSPKTLTSKDFERIKFTNNFFARKFDEEIDLKIIEDIYLRIGRE